MKNKLTFFIALFSLTSFVNAQSIGLRTEEGGVVELSGDELGQMSSALEAEAQKTEDPKTQKLMMKVSKKLKEKGDEVEKDQKNIPRLRKFGRNLGKGSVFLAVHTMKPMVRASAFFTGFFEKVNKNQDTVALYNIFLKNDHLFRNLYKEARTPLEFADLVVETFEEITMEKSKIILRDVYRSLNLSAEVPDDITEFELTDEMIDSIEIEKLDPSIVNNHPEFQDLKPFIGEITRENLFEIIQVGGISTEIGMDSYTKALPKIYELSITAFTQAIGSTVVLSTLSGIAGAIYAVPVLTADVGAAISVAICLSKNRQEQIKQDDELGQFCSYVTNWSSYQLLKSRMKGYLKGKKLKAKYIAWTTKMKERRDARREKRRIKKA